MYGLAQPGTPPWLLAAYFARWRMRISFGWPRRAAPGGVGEGIAESRSESSNKIMPTMRTNGPPSGSGPRRRVAGRAVWRRSSRSNDRSDWRQNATTLSGIVSVLLVAAGLFYTNA